MWDSIDSTVLIYIKTVYKATQTCIVSSVLGNWVFTLEKSINCIIGYFQFVNWAFVKSYWVKQLFFYIFYATQLSYLGIY